MKHIYVFSMMGLFLLLVSSAYINEQYDGIINIDTMEEKYNMGDTYQGPVPEGYDEGYFRRTGKTIKENING